MNDTTSPKHCNTQSIAGARSLPAGKGVSIRIPSVAALRAAVFRGGKVHRIHNGWNDRTARDGKAFRGLVAARDEYAADTQRLCNLRVMQSVAYENRITRVRTEGGGQFASAVQL